VTDSRIVEAFSELAPNYEKVMDWELRFMWGLGYRQFVEMLVQAVSVAEDDVILDIATGTAVIPNMLALNACAQGHIVGLDITASMLRQGAHDIRQTRTTSPISLVCASAMDIPFCGSAFDVSICGLGMHHLDVPQALSEIGRTLKVNGRLVIGAVGVPPFWRTWWGARIVARTIRFVYRLTHSGPRADAEVEAIDNLHTEQEWREILSDSLLDPIQVTVIPPRLFWGPNALIITAQRAPAPSAH
jgi:ubiquinone/menaquinone biosynthesis C-methylase UbiE